MKRMFGHQLAQRRKRQYYATREGRQKHRVSGGGTSPIRKENRTSQVGPKTKNRSKKDQTGPNKTQRKKSINFGSEHG